MEATAQETGQVTGTKDKDYNLIWFTEQCRAMRSGSRRTSRTPSAKGTRA